MFNITNELAGTTLNIAMEGILDTKTAPELEAVITEHLSNVTEINFDLAKLEYLTSAGLRVLLMAQQELDDKDGTMTLKNVSDDIMEVFDMTGFIDVLTIL